MVASRPLLFGVFTPRAKFALNTKGNTNYMKYFFARLSTRKVVIVLSVAAALCAETASAALPAKLGYAETVSGGELVLVDETCTFQGLGTGYALYLTNPHGTVIGKGCTLAGALPPELGMFMVQWGASPVQGAESYQVDDFKWTKRGRAVMAPVFKARYEALGRMKAEEDAKAKEEAADAAMVAAFNKPAAEKTYLGVVKNTKYPPTILITPKQCNLMVTEPDPSGKYSGVMVQKNNGRTALGLSGDKVAYNGCALPNSDGGITVMWDYHHDQPESFTASQISWEPKGQEWIGAEPAKGN